MDPRELMDMLGRECLAVGRPLCNLPEEAGRGVGEELIAKVPGDGQPRHPAATEDPRRSRCGG